MLPTSQDRRVRFSVEDKALEDADSVNEEALLVRSPPPPTPSPTHSASSASSGGPLTPPSPRFMMLESKGPSPLPSFTVTPKIHPSLASGSFSAWDMTIDPASDAGYGFTAVGDDSAATVRTVPVSRLMLKNETIPEWPLHIDTDAQNDPVTVMGVLRALHEHLAKGVHAEYYNHQSADVQRAASKACHNRMRQGGGQVLQRIDFLPGRIFYGLRVKADSEPNSDGVWEFRFDVGSS